LQLFIGAEVTDLGNNSSVGSRVSSRSRLHRRRRHFATPLSFTTTTHSKLTLLLQMVVLEVVATGLGAIRVLK